MTSIAELTTFEKWGYSFIGTTLGVLCVFVAPLLFTCFGKKKIYPLLPWFACFGSGVILSLVFNHNIVGSVEVLSFNWKTGSVFLGGIMTSYITTFFFTNDEHCCDICPECPECPEEKEEEHHCCDSVEMEIHSQPQTPTRRHPDSLVYSRGDVNCSITTPTSKKNTHLHNIPNEHSVKHWVFSVLIGDAFCNFSDGIMIAAAFSLCGHNLGWLTTFAVILHEISHEIGDFAIILSSGMKFNTAVIYNLMSATTSYIGWLLMNSLTYVENTHSISAYCVLYGSGVLTSLVLKMLPKYIKHTSLNIQRLRIVLVILGIVLTTLLFSFLPHCEAMSVLAINTTNHVSH